MNEGYMFIGFVFSILWTTWIFFIGQSKKKNAKMWFYILIYLPIILTIISCMFSGIINIQIIGVLGWFLVTLLVFEKVMWGFALKEISGDDKLFTFYLVYFIPLAWVIYRLTQLR